MSAPAADIALAARDVRKAYRGVNVLRSVSFSVSPGEIVGITGENGSGKSTLLRILVGLLRADGGSVELTGRLGYCDQEPALFPDLTVAEHFRYLARAYALPDGRWMPMRDELLLRFSFSQYADVPSRKLSGGTRQKLHLSLALLHRPTVVVLDEPCSAFDWETYLRFWEYAAELRRRGTAIVVVSHVAYERSRFDRVLALREGAIACA